MKTTNVTVHPVGKIECPRRARGWRQADLAARAGIHRTVVSRVEAGHLPGAGVRALIADALEVAEGDIFLTRSTPRDTDPLV
jgi:transcriptional regulator with XRE-family HTH domain